MTGMREHDARAYADASTEHDAPAYATDGRTDGLTQKHSPNAESSPSVSRAGGQNESVPSQPVSELSVPAPQPNPSTEDGWVRFYFDDADPVAECACGWHTHGDSASDAFGAWWKHRREHDDAAGEQRPVVLSARVDLDLDQIEARANAATAGPWQEFYGSMSDGEQRYYVGQVGPTVSVKDVTGDGMPRADAEFIAHAREDVPRLVAEVRRLREETEKWRDRMTEHSDCEHRNAAELRRLHAEADDLRRQLLNETYRPEGGEIVMRELGKVKRERDAARAEAERLNAELDALRNLDGEVWRGAETVKQLEDARLKIAELSDEIVVHKAAKEVLRAEAARVREALQAARDLHVAGRCGCDPNSPHSTGHCRVCGIKAGWPCATVRALDAALDGAE